MANCGISQRAASDGPPGSPAPANARRRTEPNREKSTGLSRGSVALVARALVRRRSPGADDPDDVLEDFRVNDIEQPASMRLADEDEPLRMERIRVVGAEFVVERRDRLLERDTVLPQVGGRLAGVPREPHVKLYYISALVCRLVSKGLHEGTDVLWRHARVGLSLIHI